MDFVSSTGEIIVFWICFFILVNCVFYDIKVGVGEVALLDNMFGVYSDIIT
jgi:hypothetical protein